MTVGTMGDLAVFKCLNGHTGSEIIILDQEWMGERLGELRAKLGTLMLRVGQSHRHRNARPLSA